MKLLLLDIEGEATGLDLAMRAQAAGHEVQYWQPPHATGEPLPYGEGLVQRPEEWEPHAYEADLIVVNGNSRYHARLNELIASGYPVFGFSEGAAELELDRAVGQQVLDDHGIATVPYTVVSSAEEGIAYIAKEGQPYVMKPWGGEADKAMTFVASTPEDAIFTLQKWEREGKFKGQLMLQEKVEGQEIGIAAWFGPGGFSKMLEESFEHKKLMPGDLGPNTGEMGTVIRHVSHSKLFDKVLAPLADYLHQMRYVGDVSVNCIVDAEGNPWPLEFTTRLGHPDFAIRYELLRGDPIEWMLDLVQGRDTFSVSPQIAVGVVLAHGDFPHGGDILGTWADYPITLDTGGSHVHWQMVKRGTTPTLEGGSVGEEAALVTAGSYVAVVTGSGRTVRKAADSAYGTVEGIHWPGDIMYRHDIGDRVRKALTQLQKNGYASGMEY